MPKSVQTIKVRTIGKPHPDCFAGLAMLIADRLQYEKTKLQRAGEAQQPVHMMPENKRG